jgi:hypothetical protein
MARSSPSGTDSDTDELDRYTFSSTPSTPPTEPRYRTPFVNPFNVVLNVPSVKNIDGRDFTPGENGDYVIGYPMLGIEGTRKYTEDVAAVAIARGARIATKLGASSGVAPGILSVGGDTLDDF